MEVEVEDLQVLNTAIPQLPFSVGEYQKVMFGVTPCSRGYKTFFMLNSAKPAIWPAY